MKPRAVPLHVVRASRSPADALYLPAENAGPLLALLARGEVSADARTYAVAGGFVVVENRPIQRPSAGVIGLRCLGANLYVPTNGNLHPVLLPDELDGLTRGRGLVFLPGGRILSFALDRPLQPPDLLSVGERRFASVRPLPASNPRSTRIVEILVEPPAGANEDPLESAGGEIGTEDSPTESGSAANQAAGRVSFEAGRGMVWLGKNLGLQGLSRLGARLMDAAAGKTPRFSESLMGRQERVLRELLREFREGSVERALRSALPVSSGNERGAPRPGGDRLPENDLRYSLGKLLAGPGRGGGSYWFGAYDIQRELTLEYEKAAEAAARTGDFRRAAYIHGRLLGDYRAAANALTRGGYHRDAALVLLEKVGDTLGAARAFEAAGETDRALSLYRSEKAYELAGDLLHLLGEEEAATSEYVLAADEIISKHGDHLAAGQLLAIKARRDDLARKHYEAGWSRRPASSALACGRELLQVHTRAGEPGELLELAEVAQTHFQTVGLESAGIPFFQDLARAAETPSIVDAREELRDRALLGLARALRARPLGTARQPTTAAHLFSTAGPWPAEVVRDAEFAASPNRSAAPPLRAPSVVGRSVRITSDRVTAVARAAESDELFIGFEGGAVYRYRPKDGSASRLASYSIPVADLAVDPGGSFLAVLWKGAAARSVVAAYARRPDGSMEMTEGRTEPHAMQIGLAAGVASESVPTIGLWIDGRLKVLRGRVLISEYQQALDTEALIAVVTIATGDPPAYLGIHQDMSWFVIVPDALSTVAKKPFGWKPGSASELIRPRIDCLAAQRNRWELAGVDASGTLYRTVFTLGRNEVGARRPDEVTTNVSASDLGFRCACLIRPGVVAAATLRSVHVLRGVSKRFVTVCVVDHEFASPVACFASDRTREIIVVGRDGTVDHVATDGF